MYARVTVTTDQRKDALVVPANAVVDTGGRRGVFLAADNSTVSFRPVSIGIEESTQIEILDGISEGDRVVTTGAAGLRDGDRVVLASGDGPSDTPGATRRGGAVGPDEGGEGGRLGGGGGGVRAGGRGEGAGRQGGAREAGRRGGFRGQQGTP
jgi:macrolide-specific efflux system membrane fusion protein